MSTFVRRPHDAVQDVKGPTAVSRPLRRNRLSAAPPEPVLTDERTMHATGP